MKPETYIKRLIRRKGIQKKIIADRLEFDVAYVSHALKPRSRHARRYTDQFIKELQTRIIAFLEAINL